MPRKKPFVFVLMPFDESFRDVYDVAIKGACKKANVYCDRVDEMDFPEPVYDRIITSINVCDFLVADLSGCNANVFYELGYAHSLGKLVILLVRSTEEVPFDLKGFPHLVHGTSLVRLRDRLTRKLKWAVARLDSTPGEQVGHGKVYLNRVPCEADATFPLWQERIAFPGPVVHVLDRAMMGPSANRRSRASSLRPVDGHAMVPLVVVEIASQSDQMITDCQVVVHTQAAHCTVNPSSALEQLWPQIETDLVVAAQPPHLVDYEAELTNQLPDYGRKFLVARDVSVSPSSSHICKLYFFGQRNYREANDRPEIRTELTRGKLFLIRITTRKGPFDITCRYNKGGCFQICSVTPDHPVFD